MDFHRRRDLCRRIARCIMTATQQSTFCYAKSLRHSIREKLLSSQPGKGSKWYRSHTCPRSRRTITTKTSISTTINASLLTPLSQITSQLPPRYHSSRSSLPIRATHSPSCLLAARSCASTQTLTPTQKQWKAQKAHNFPLQ